MPDDRLAQQPHRYRVRVGHESVAVRCGSPEEAIREARRILCLEMPRLWDVICGLEDCRFQVAPEELPRRAPSRPGQSSPHPAAPGVTAQE